MEGLQGLDQTLELLKGPTDERRFVGLLMAAKSLPPGDEQAIRKVYDAAGEKFFRRLLLPLQSTQAPIAGQEGLQKSAATCALGLAVLSSLYQSQDIANLSEEIQRIPLFMKVVRQKGIMAALGAETIPQEALETEQLSLQDALQCLLGLALGSQEGRTVVIESGALPAVAAVLAAASTCQQSALRLLIATLDHPSRPDILEERAGDVPRLVPALASLLGAEGAALQRGDSTAGPAAADPAAVQLEVLHALLLLLPPPQEAEAQLKAAAEGGNAAWMLAARRGLQLLLKAKIAPRQRQAVLRLVAAFSQFSRPTWLLGDVDCIFFRLLVELVKVEIVLLLRDALASDAPIPPDWASTNPKSEPQSTAFGAETAGERAAANLPSLLQLFEGLLQALGDAQADSEDLPGGAAERAMSSLTEAAEAMVQFLEEVMSQQRDEPLALAAVRALGRFAAEVGAFEVPRLCRLLPWMVGLQGREGLPFLLPMLLHASAGGAATQPLLTAAKAAQVVTPLSEYIQQLTKQPRCQPELYQATAVLAGLAEDCGEAGTSSDAAAFLHLRRATAAAAQALVEWAAAPKESIEPRLLAYIGHVVALALAAGAESWPANEVTLASRTVLLALEVGDRLLALVARRGTETRTDRFDLKALGVSLPTPGNGPGEEEEEDLGEEVREQSIRTLRLAAGLKRSLPAFRQAAAASPWVSEASARGASKLRSAYSDALQAFCRAISAAS